jgi:hypothetical protein
VRTADSIALREVLIADVGTMVAERAGERVGHLVFVLLTMSNSNIAIGIEESRSL